MPKRSSSTTQTLRIGRLELNVDLSFDFRVEPTEWADVVNITDGTIMIVLCVMEKQLNMAEHRHEIETGEYKRKVLRAETTATGWLMVSLLHKRYIVDHFDERLGVFCSAGAPTKKGVNRILRLCQTMRPIKPHARV
jgi:hypothetical protein